MAHNNLQIIDWLLLSGKSVTPAVFVDFSAFRQAFFATSISWKATVDRATSGGFVADCAAYAFAAGYCSALQCLVPGLPHDTLACLCITEEGGGHPRAVKSQLSPLDTPHGTPNALVLNGRKKFVTCAQEAEILIVAASEGTNSDGKNRIRMVRLESNAPGIEIVPMKELHLVPEISHGKISFTNVAVTDSNVLPGDGYLNYIKPFRTIEDLHMSAAILGYLYRQACWYGWDRSVKIRILSRISSIRPLTFESPNAPAVHIVLGDVLKQIQDLIEDLEPFWIEAEEVPKAAWDRDKILMKIADKARTRRLQTAWDFYAYPPE